ncbi:MAG: hypothetical protein LUC90_08365 [Lachnospiraceae bacterium]|nr:hypothetical protein [Lachnospiraceae bacterium]
MMRSNTEKRNTSRNTAAVTTAVLSVLLFLYTFRKVSIGIDATDTGYHFANFLYMDRMDSMWIFSTYLASKLGHFFTLLPGGETLLGINIYTSLIPAALAVITFLFFTKCMKTPAGLSFAGVFMALNLCWCPTTCVYNYLTYLFFGAGVMLLWLGLTRDERKYMIFSGVLLGLNVLVRFPNLTEMSLILAVWFYGLLKKKKFPEVAKATGFCVLGYGAGIAVVMLQIQIQYGIGNYIQGIVRLFGMTDSAQDYTPYAMVYNLIQSYFGMGWWLYILLLAVMLGVLGFMILPGKWEKIKKGGYFACCILLMAFFWYRGLFVFQFDSLSAVLGPTTLLMLAVLVLALAVLLMKSFSAEKKLLALIVIIIIGITPIGSNNQMTTTVNFMFLPLCFVMDTLWQMFGKRGAAAVEKRSSNKSAAQAGTALEQGCVKETYALALGRGGFKLSFSNYPVKAMSIVYLALLLYLSTGFGANYVFRDDTSNGERTVQVESIGTLKGMKTSEVRAALWEELGEFAAAEGLSGSTGIFYGNVPALSAYLKMPFLMSPWLDLDSYSEEVFGEELAQIEENLDSERPYILIGPDFKVIMAGALENGMDSEQFTEFYGFKFGRLYDMIAENGYSCIFSNEICDIYY